MQKIWNYNRLFKINKLIKIYYWFEDEINSSNNLFYIDLY